MLVYTSSPLELIFFCPDGLRERSFKDVVPALQLSTKPRILTQLPFYVSPFFCDFVNIAVGVMYFREFEVNRRQEIFSGCHVVFFNECGDVVHRELVPDAVNAAREALLYDIGFIPRQLEDANQGNVISIVGRDQCPVFTVDFRNFTLELPLPKVEDVWRIDRKST